MQKASIRHQVQELYKKGTALGIFWGLGFAVFDLTMRTFPFGQFYISFITSVTVPLYAQWTEFTMSSPLLLWLGNSVMTIVYFLLGYGVKITSSALVGCWTAFLHKIMPK